MFKDKNIREQLNQREINPSIDAWDKLNAQLSNGEMKNEVAPKRSNKKLWLSIAASIILIIGVGTLFNLNNSTKSAVVKSSSEKSTPTENTSVTKNEKLITHPVASVSKTSSTRTNIQKSVSKKEIALEKPSVQPNTTYYNDFLAGSEESVDSLIDTKFEPTIIAKNYVDTVQPSDLLTADELLEEAMLRRQLKDETTIAVDRRELLNSVEEDIFQEKKPDLLDKLTLQIKSIQVAINQRNQKE